MDSNNTSLEVLPHLPKHEFLHDQSNVIIMNFNLISSQRAQKKKQKKKKKKKKKTPQSVIMLQQNSLVIPDHTIVDSPSITKD